MASPADPAAEAAAQHAAQEAFRKSMIEIWTLFAVGVCVTLLRVYARVKAVGFRNLRADDYLVWLGVTFYAAQSTLGYFVGKAAHGLANSSMTDAERAALSVSDPEYNFRVIGSKIQVAGWTIYSALIWSLKLSILAFYVRLTDGLSRRYRLSILIGFGLVAATFLASIITIFGACRPLHKYWQIWPNPGNVCQAGVSRPIVWVSYAANISTDIYLILIPIPMLWKSTLKLYKKIASTFVFSVGLFVLVCATLKTVFVIVDPVHGAEQSAAWGIREAFVAVITANLPMIFPLIRALLRPIFGRALSTSHGGGRSYKSPAGFQTIGGGHNPGGDYYRNSGSRRNNRRTPGSNAMSGQTGNLSYHGSEERMVDNVRMHDIKAFANTHHDPRAPPTNAIMVSNQVEVTREASTEEGSSSATPNDDPHVQREREVW